MVTHADKISELEENIELLKARIGQLEKKKEDIIQSVENFLRNAFSRLGENYSEDLVSYISQQLDEYILENYISKKELENYLSREDLRDVLNEICDLLQTGVGVNTALLENKILLLVNEK